MSYETFIARFPSLKDAVDDLPGGMRNQLEKQPDETIKFLEDIKFLKSYVGPPVMLYMPLEFQQQMQYPYSLVRQSWNAAMNEYNMYLSIIEELSLINIQNQRMQELLKYYLSRFSDGKKEAATILSGVFTAILSDKPAKNVLDILANLPSQAHELQALKYQLTNEIVIPKAVEALEETFSEQYLNKYDPTSEEYKQHAEIAERFDELREKLVPEKREELIQHHRDKVEQEYEDAGEDITESEVEYRAQHKFNLNRTIEMLGIFRDAENLEYSEADELEQTGVLRRAKEIVEGEIERQGAALGLGVIDEKLSEVQQTQSSGAQRRPSRRGVMTPTNHFSTAPKWLKRPDDETKAQSVSALEKLTYHIAQVEKSEDMPGSDKDIFYAHAASLVDVLDGINRDEFTVHNNRIIQVNGVNDVTTQVENVVNTLAGLNEGFDDSYLKETCNVLNLVLPTKEETAMLTETESAASSANAAVFRAEESVEDAVEKEVEKQEGAELESDVDFGPLIEMGRELCELLDGNDKAVVFIEALKDFEASPDTAKIEVLITHSNETSKFGLPEEVEDLVYDYLDLLEEKNEASSSPRKGI